VRNKLWTFGGKAFGPLDWCAYAGGTLRRWARTLARSRQRGALLRVGWRGLRDALSHRPRPAEAVVKAALYG